MTSSRSAPPAGILGVDRTPHDQRVCYDPGVGAQPSARRVSVPHALAFCLALLLAARLSSIWPQLPERMASHFGPSGRPDAWMPRASFIVTLLGAGVGTSALLLLMSPLLRRLPPSMINLPHREYWLAEERRAESMRRLSQNLAWLGFCTAAFMAFVAELTLEANLAHSALDNRLFIAGLLAYALAIFVLMIALFRAFRVPDA